ncbi:MAG: hypothetical protein M0Z75_02950 [Nitrospiraceae bacterium]|nr:hypothetical protein [Nitrospiraceae bacterium]
MAFDAELEKRQAVSPRATRKNGDAPLSSTARAEDKYLKMNEIIIKGHP